MGVPAGAYYAFGLALSRARCFMGVLDKLFGSDSGKDKKATADFSDVRSGSSSTAPQSQSGAFNHTYTVVAGDSLSKIAKREYGDASKWHRIFEANRDKIQNPDLIHPGQVLNLPQG
jgi:nucleoid-associated protein YgaU